MDNQVKIVTPRYQKIALDIAAKIVDKQYEIGEKLYARSALALQYGVSSETARRATSVLADMGIVEVIKGSGIIITSYENAVKFLKQHKDIQTLNNLKADLLKRMDRQMSESFEMREQVIKLVERIDRFKSINPFIPFEIQVTADTPLLNQTSSNVNFWHNTTATIVAIKRDNQLLMSPGPYASFKENDTIYFLGDENAYEKVYHFFYPEI